MSTTKFWAGGSRDGWFVKMSREQEVYPGHKPADVVVQWFPVTGYPTGKGDPYGELGAARAADRLAMKLNEALS